MNRWTKASLGAVVVLAASLLATAPAQAAEEPDTIDVSSLQVLPGVDLDGPLVAVDENGTEYPAVIQGGQVLVDAQPLAGCSWYNMVIPVGGAWYNSVNGCSLIGFDATSKHYYQWVVDPNSNGTACMQGRGYKKVGVSWVEAYYGLGCGSNGSGNLTIGNVITNAKVKGQSIGTTGTSLRWM